MNWKDFYDQMISRLPPIDEKNRYYYLAGVLLVVFLLDYFLIMQPQLKTLMTINPKITMTIKEYQKAKDDIRHVDDYAKELEKLRRQQIRVGNAIVMKEEIPTILQNISLLADIAGIKINQVVPLKDSEKVVMENEDGKYYILPILVDARGGYHNFGHFFNRLETDSMFMNVSGFDIAANVPDPLNHFARITVNAYFLEKSSGEKAISPTKDKKTDKKVSKKK